MFVLSSLDGSPGVYCFGLGIVLVGLLFGGLDYRIGVCGVFENNMML